LGTFNKKFGFILPSGSGKMFMPMADVGLLGYEFVCEEFKKA